MSNAKNRCDSMDNCGQVSLAAWAADWRELGAEFIVALETNTVEACEKYVRDGVPFFRTLDKFHLDYDAMGQLKRALRK